MFVRRAPKRGPTNPVRSVRSICNAFLASKEKKLTFARAGHWVGKLLTFVVTWVVKVGLPMSLEVTCDVGST